jgi:hypothetical protein
MPVPNFKFIINEYVKEDSRVIYRPKPVCSTKLVAFLTHCPVFSINKPDV